MSEWDTSAPGRSDDGPARAAPWLEGRSRRGGADSARGSSAAQARCRAGGWAPPIRMRPAGSARWAPSAARRPPSSHRCKCSCSRGRPGSRPDGSPAGGAPSRQHSHRLPTSSLPSRACRTRGSRRCRSPPGSEAPEGRAHRGGGAGGEKDDARMDAMRVWRQAKVGCCLHIGTGCPDCLFLGLSEPHLCSGQGVGAVQAVPDRQFHQKSAGRRLPRAYSRISASDARPCRGRTTWSVAPDAHTPRSRWGSPSRRLATETRAGG